MPVPNGPAVPEKVVLVVEDDDGVRALFDLLLDDPMLWDVGPLRAVCVADAAAAWRAVADVTPALVLLDLLLPGDEDGLALCRRMLAEARFGRVPVVAVSAFAPPEEGERLAREAGCVAYVRKPFELDDLLSVVGAQLGASTGHDALERTP